MYLQYFVSTYSHTASATYSHPLPGACHERCTLRTIPASLFRSNDQGNHIAGNADPFLFTLNLCNEIGQFPQPWIAAEALVLIDVAKLKKKTWRKCAGPHLAVGAAVELRALSQVSQCTLPPIRCQILVAAYKLLAAAVVAMALVGGPIALTYFRVDGLSDNLGFQRRLR